VVGATDFPFSKLSRPALEPPSLLINNYWPFCPGGAGAGGDVDHLPPNNAKVKNEWRSTYTPPICSHGVDKENF